MKLQYNAQDFFDRDEIKEISGFLKNGTITRDHIHAYVAQSVIDVYNDLYFSVCNLMHVSSLASDDIIQRGIFSEWMERQSRRYKVAESFKACKDNGLIGICGRGYTFDRGRITDAEISRLASEMAVALILAA